MFRVFLQIHFQDLPTLGHESIWWLLPFELIFDVHFEIKVLICVVYGFTKVMLEVCKLLVADLPFVISCIWEVRFLDLCRAEKSGFRLVVQWGLSKGLIVEGLEEWVKAFINDIWSQLLKVCQVTLNIIFGIRWEQESLVFATKLIKLIIVIGEQFLAGHFE